MEDVCFNIYLIILYFIVFLLQAHLERFRVAELKELLKMVGLAHSGRKADLFYRANLLLMRGSLTIQKGIEEIYERERAHLRKPIKSMAEPLSIKDLHRCKSELRPELKSFNSSYVVKDPRQFVMHPDVRFKVHPFYKVLECIVKPTALGKGCLYGYDISSSTV